MAAPATCIVMVRAEHVGNVAAACRAMKNMSLQDLRLVAPPQGLLDSPERALAYGAFDVLEAARGYQSLREATADAHFVVAVSGRADLPALSPRQLPAEIASRARGGTSALVFGPERTGLSAEELRLCHATVRIPADPAQPSLNLAQAVLVVAYELFVAARPGDAPAPAAAPEVTAGDLEAVLDELRQALLGIGYLSPANPEAILSELRRLLARAGPTRRELSLLRGVARQAAWAGRVAAERHRGG
jgi:tRNA (cytidine32/uridine32-2'-O)-methyltransferase